MFQDQDQDFVAQEQDQDQDFVAQDQDQDFGSRLKLNDKDVLIKKKITQKYCCHCNVRQLVVGCETHLPFHQFITHFSYTSSINVCVAFEVHYSR